MLLGAGRPSKGSTPSALKVIAKNTKALDWHLSVFEELSTTVNINYLGGFQVEEVVKSYPSLNFTVIPGWEDKTVLHTLLKAPFSSKRAFVSYTDTLFRKGFIEELLDAPYDFAFGVDSTWRSRYFSREKEDMDSAETICTNNFNLPNEYKS